MRRAQDLCRIAENRGVARYSGFLSDREQSLAKAAMNQAGCAWAAFEGGYPAAERKLLCLEPAGASGGPPICCVLIRCAGAGPGAPAHKDYLGSVLGLGLERECVGDILPDPDAPGTAYAFVLERVAPLICDELTSVGRWPARAVCRAAAGAACPAGEQNRHRPLPAGGRGAGGHAPLQPRPGGGPCAGRQAGDKPRPRDQRPCGCV